MACRHISGYAGLTYLIYYAGEGMPGYLTCRVGGPAYRSGIWPTVISGTQKSAKGSNPYNQGEVLPSMERDRGDRVHSGGLPTLTVHKYKLTSGW
jgi:hypothetical protein